ncbi:dienelactone hydrolase family protein [Synechococcus sp. RS9915]|nr:dienelactone hydrolase family protein [Synechococcus sp. RS9915]
MQAMADGLAKLNWRVHRFDFPYMARRRLTGQKTLPDRPDVLPKAFKEAVDELDQRHPLVIGGKSMGGRIASLLLDELHDSSTVAAGVCLGYPFHPLGKPAQLRTQHLIDLSAPCLIVQGERDGMGRKDEVEVYPLSSAVTLQWIPDGDHSFSPRKRSGRTQEQNLGLAVQHVHSFLAWVCC